MRFQAAVGPVGQAVLWSRSQEPALWLQPMPVQYWIRVSTCRPRAGVVAGFGPVLRAGRAEQPEQPQPGLCREHVQPIGLLVRCGGQRELLLGDQRGQHLEVGVGAERGVATRTDV